jgi:putative protease
VKKPEVLAPVGNIQMCQAAVHNGADAIYVGLPGFNARGRVELLTIETLKEIIDFCHIYGTKVFIAANILIFERELSEIESVLREVIPLKPDAFIVQDVGLIRLIHSIAPDQVIHASTQMTVTSYEAIELTSDLEIQRYVLGRENSVDEIRKIRQNTSKELEVFVHGALCVSYSGQCLTSESFGGRSANRGQCAQSCRLPYELIVDGNRYDDGKRPYVVSPQDLCGLEDVPELIEIGVDSFKIEGRLKSPAYVADTVRHYRAKIDGKLSDPNDSKAAILEMAQTYSRGFYNGWIKGVNHQKLVDGRYSNHHGVEVGQVTKINSNSIRILATQKIEPSDGLIFCDFDAPVVSQRNIGANIYQIKNVSDSEVDLYFSNDFELDQLKVGMKVFRNKSVILEKRLARSYEVKHELRKIPVDYSVCGSIGQPLTCTISDDLGNQIQISSQLNIDIAKKTPVTNELIKSELFSLSATPFEGRNIEFNIPDSIFLPNKEVKVIRQKLTEALIEKRKATNIKVTINDQSANNYKRNLSNFAEAKTDQSQLSVLLRDKSQIDAVKGLDLDFVYLDFEYGKDYGDAVQIVRDFGHKVGIATTRILKPGEIGHLKVIERLKVDTILVRNLGALHYFQNKGFNLRGDFSLNITNSISASWFLSKGLSTLCPSYDLNHQQLEELLCNIDPSLAEITIHQYMPAFHMEHCVFASFLSSGTSWRDCGKPCEKHRVELRDPKGKLHPLKPDAECRNTMFNGTAQSAIKLIPKLQSLGVCNFRLEALFEDSTLIRDKIQIYLKALKGEVLSSELIKRLDIIEQYGVTDGQLFNINSFKDRKKAPVQHVSLP